MTDYSNSSIPDRPMKWHKFLAYFGLWLGAFTDFGQAGMLISGAHYGPQRDLVYQVYENIKTVDMICGLGYILVAVFSIYTAIQLIKLKKDAPKKLMMLYVITTALAIVYLLMASFSTGISIAELANRSIFTSVIGCVLGLIICKVYYGKRSHMFVN